MLGLKLNHVSKRGHRWFGIHPLALWIVSKNILTLNMLMFQIIFDCLFYFSSGWITRLTFLIPLLLFPRTWTTCIVLANVCSASVKHFIIKSGQHHLVGEGNQILSTPPAHKSSICWTKETLLLQFCKRSFGQANQVCLSEFHTAMT